MMASHRRYRVGEPPPCPALLVAKRDAASASRPLWFVPAVGLPIESGDATDRPYVRHHSPRLSDLPRLPRTQRQDHAKQCDQYKKPLESVLEAAITMIPLVFMRASLRICDIQILGPNAAFAQAEIRMPQDISE
jgi:hypothetical protein